MKPPTRSITSKVKLATQVPTKEVIVSIESRVPTSEMNSSAEVPPEMTLAKTAESSVAESRVPTSEMNSSAEVPPEMTLAKSAESSVAESQALSEMAVEES